MESPAKTSRIPSTGMARISPAVRRRQLGLRVCHQPAASQAPSPAPKPQERSRRCALVSPSRCTSRPSSCGLSISRPMPGISRMTSCLAVLPHGLAVRQKTVVAEAQRNDRGRPPQNAVAAPAVIGGNEHRAFLRAASSTRCNSSASNQRNVAGHDDRSCRNLALRTMRSPSR